MPSCRSLHRLPSAMSSSSHLPAPLPAVAAVLLLLLLVGAAPACAQLSSTASNSASRPAAMSAASPSALSPAPSLSQSPSLPSSLPPLSSLPGLRNLSDLLLPSPAAPNGTLGSTGSSPPSTPSSSFSLFGSAPYLGQYSSRLSAMSAALPSLWRLELTVPQSVAASTSLVEVHLLLERDADQSFAQPAATTAANAVTSSVGSAVFTPITNSEQLAPLFPATNVALNYSRSASATETLLAALFSASPATNVQLNYLMRQQPDVGHYSIDYIAFQPQLNQSLWYYFTLHTGAAGLDTKWQCVTADAGVSSLPSAPLVELADPTEPQLLDVSSVTAAGSPTIDQPDFVWKTAVVPATSSASTSNAPPPLPTPAANAAGSAAAAPQYRIALFTNASALLWANVAWQRGGDGVVRASMSQLSPSQFLSPPLTLQYGDVLTYQLSWWDLASNAEQRSPLTFLFRPPTAEAVQLTEAASSGSSSLPGGTNLGDGQSVWTKLKQAAQSSLAPLPAAPAPPAGLGTLPLGLSSPSSSSAVGSVTGAISSGLTSLLSSLSTLQAGPVQVLSDGRSVTVQSTGAIKVAPPADSRGVAAATTNGTSSVSTQSLVDLITPLALISSLAGLTSPTSPSSSALSDMSTYAGAAFCVLPCATSSSNSDVMVSCLAGCAQPFLPASLPSSEASSVINALHDYIVTNVQKANLTLPSRSNASDSADSSSAAPSQANASNVTQPERSGDTVGSVAEHAVANTSAPFSSTAITLVPTANSSSSAATPSGSSTSTGQLSPPARPNASLLPPAAASNILNWLTTTQSAATPSLLSGAPLLPTGAGSLSGPASTLASSLSSGLGFLSSPLLAGLSSLSTGQVSIASSSPGAGGITIASLGQSVSLPLSVLSALLTPLLPPGTSTAAVASTASYVAGMTCMLPCLGGSSTAGVSSTSSCIGTCVDAVMPGTGTGGAKLVADIDAVMQRAASDAAPVTQRTVQSAVSSSPASSSAAPAPSSSAQPGVAVAPPSSASAARAVLSSTGESASVIASSADASAASDMLSLTGAGSGATQSVITAASPS